MNKQIKPEAILILPNRQRREHSIEAHQELIESIRNNGLLHAPVLRLARAGESDVFKYVLVAGERRFRAMLDMLELGEVVRYEGEPCDEGMIPYTFLGDLSLLQAEECELEENLRREDLTWQELAAATLRLQELRNRQVEAGLRERPTQVEFVKEIRGQANANDQDAVRTSLQVAKHLDNPAIAKAKTAKEAVKILKNIERDDRNRVLAETVGKTMTSVSHTLVNEDTIEWLVKQPAGMYDVILTDPPYGMGADEFGDSGGAAAGAHGYSDDEDYFYYLMDTFMPETFRVAKDQAHLYLFCDIDKFAYIRKRAIEAGWTPLRTPMIWFKPNGQRAPWPEHGPQRKYETILYAMKGKKPVNVLKGDVLEYSTDENLGHSAQKPVALYRDLLSRSYFPGCKVLDCFGGTGPVLPAAHDLKCYATVVEKDQASFGICVQRLKDLK